jgi:cytochrome c oxidase subunit 2
MKGTRDNFSDVWGPYLTIGTCVAVLVIATILFVAFRYRARGGEDRERPHQRAEWLGRVVYVWLAAIAVIVAVTLTLTFRAQDDISALGSDEPAATIDVTAFQWGWRFDYGDGVSVVGNAQRIPTLIVPSGELVRFNLVSRDVIHSFWIPEERFKRDAFPDREVHFGLVFGDSASEGRCAEFCGLEHYRMDFHVTPVSPSAFDDWLAERRSGEGTS